MQGIDYSKQTTPDAYRCCNCDIDGCKLWRESSTFSPDLLCAKCAAENQLASIADIDTKGTRSSDLIPGSRTDQIGGYVPAVPDEEGIGYWSYGAIPEVAYKWWQQLPTALSEAA